MRRLQLFSFALLALAGCSGGGDGGGGPVTPPPTPTITAVASPATVSVTRGASGTSTITVTRGGNYTGAVQLATGGTLPNGVTVTFNPSALSSSTTTSVATIAASATATGGSVQIVASGTGVTNSTTNVTVEVPTPAITFTATPTTADVVQGATRSIGLTITRAGGYTGAVTVAATGLPTGVSAATVTIAAGATTGTIDLTASATATPTATATPVLLTASGTGVTTQTQTVNLTVTSAAVSGFSLAAANPALSIAAGQTGTSAITLTRTGTFAGAVALTVTNAPAGVTATVNPTSIAASATTASLSVVTTAAAVPGTYNLTITGTATGVTPNPSTTVAVTIVPALGITVASSATTVTTAAGTPGGATITLTRLGGFTGDVTLAATGAPAGVTAAFTPATLTGTTVTSALNLTVAGSVPQGTYPIVVNASGALAGGGTTTAQVTVSLVVTAAQGYTLSASAASLQQGSTGTSTVTITRTGGFTGAVNLAITNLPSGVTAAFNPVAPTGNTSTVTFSAAAGATTGAFTATITGTATGLANITTTVAGSVTTGSGGGGGGNVSWTFCSTDRFPVWFAVQNGNGAWTAVTPTGTTNRVYSFTVGGSGGVAYAIPRSGGGTDVTVSYLSATEMGASGTQECTTSRPTRTLTGTVAGLVQAPPLTTQSASVFVGFGSGSASANGPITVERASAGISDLLAIRQSTTIDLATFSFTMRPDKAILRRNVNYTSTIPLLDFAGAEAFTPTSAQYSVANLAGEQTLLATSLFSTANGSTGAFVTTNLTAASPVTVYGVPSALVQAGDQHQVLVAATSTIGTTSTVTSTRMVYMYNQQMANRTITLGAQPPALTPTTLGSAPYVRLSATGTWQADYPDAIGIGYTQSTANSNSWTLTASRSYTGSGATWTLAIPDFSGVTGFQSSWGLGSRATNWAFTGSGILSGLNPVTGQFSEGGTWRAASRTGSVTP